VNVLPPVVTCGIMVGFEVILRGDYDEYYFLEDVTPCLPTNELSNKCLKPLVASLACFSVLKALALRSSETPSDFYQTTRWNVPDDRNFPDV
jgi:hypothetical protein